MQDLKKSHGFEKLQIVVNSLYNIRKNTVRNKLESNIRLDAKKVYTILKDLVGSVVNVLLDENGGLFSHNLTEEASASLYCVKIIQHLVKNESNESLRPIIIVSKRNRSVVILAIMTSHFQAIDSSKTYPILYSFEPTTGKRDLLQSTQYKLFETYLTKGSKNNGIHQIFEPCVQISEDTSSVGICKNSQENDTWLCVYYSLLLVHEGSDKFLNDRLTWLDADVNDIKTILVAYVPSILAAKGKEKKITTKNSNLNKLSNAEQELAELFHERKRDLETKMNSTKHSSIDQQINRLEIDEVRLRNANHKLIDEITRIEEIIKQGESLLLSSKKDATTEQRFQSFITGQEKHALELKIRKKIEKSKQDILMYNESERNKIFSQQIKKLEQDLQLAQNNIQNLNSSIDKLNIKLSHHDSSIRKENDSLKSLALQLDQLNNKFRSKEIDEIQIKSIQSEINQINVDYEYTNLIDRLLEDDIRCDKKQVNLLNTSLKENVSKIQQLESCLAMVKNCIDKNNTRVSQLRVLIDSENSSISSLRSRVSSVNSKISQLNEEYESHNRWYSSWLYASERERISNEITQQEDNLKNLNNQINTSEINIQSYRNEIDLLEATNEQSRKDQINKQTELNRTEDYQKETIQSLKNVKDQLVSNYMEMIREIAKEKMEISKAIEVNHSCQSEANESISRNSIEINRLNQQIQRQTLSFQIAECSKNEIIQKIAQTNEKLKSTETIKNLLEPAKISEKKKHFENSLIESEIISDEQFKKLMNIISMQLNDNYQTWKLLYRASRDGFDSNSFHQKCDSHSNTLTIIRTDTLRIFGGFTGSTWFSDANEFKSDPYAFLFNLTNDSNNNLIIKCSDEKNAIYCDKNFGPCFGNGDIKISNLSNSNNKNESTLGFTYGDQVFEYGSKESKTFLAGSQFFRVDDIEVFCKDYESLEKNELKNYISMTNKSRKTILQAYEIFNTIAVNGMISLDSFITYLVQKIKIFRNGDELNEMKKLFEFIFHQFDEDKSGLLEFNEFITCFCIFDTKNKSEIPSLFLEFFFDYADKDKSQTLELDELNQLLDQFPLIFKTNSLIQNLKECLLHKQNQSLTKSEFLNLLDENKKKKINLDYKELLDKNLINSAILNNCQEYGNLMKLCDFEDQKWKLIYRASHDGFRAENFHLKCNNHFNTLTLIKAKNCDLFGGYACRAWSSIDEYLTDEFSFVFVLKNKANDSIKKQNVGLMNNAKLGPCFGKDLLQISNLSNLNNQSKMNIDSSGIDTFQVEEIEVFAKDYADLSQEEAKFFEKQYQIEAIDLKGLYHIFQSIASNGLMKIDKLVQFFFTIAEQNVKKEEINFLKKIFFYFDEEKSGLFKFSDFLKCLSLLDEDKDFFFKFLFDLADKDKNNSLDEDEIRAIFEEMPLDILNNKNALEYALKELKKSNGFLNRDQFLELIYKIKDNRYDDDNDDDDVD